MGWEKEATYIKGFAAGHSLPQTLIALQLAKKYHEGQTRKTGEPYIMHPVRVCGHLIALGIVDDEILAAALLHDVLEDTKARSKDLIWAGISQETCEIIELVSKKKQLDDLDYYQELLRNPKSCLVKIADRCNNVATMSGAFSIEKIQQYINETFEYVMDICKKTKDAFPQYSDQIFCMRYQLESTMAAYALAVKLAEQTKAAK